MISTLLAIGMSLSAHAETLCKKEDKEVAKVLNEYVQAYDSAQTEKLKKTMTEDMWEQFKDFAPKKVSSAHKVKISEANLKNGFCLVRFSINKTLEPAGHDALFVLKKSDSSWKIYSILPSEH